MEPNDFMNAFEDKPEASAPEPAALPEPSPAPVVPEAAPVAAPIITVPASGSVPALAVEPKPAVQPEYMTRAQIEDREARQKAEREADELRQQLNPVEIPDPAKDPQGYREYERQTQNIALLNERLNMSEMFARDKHGNERIDTVQNWFLERSKTDPQLFQRVMQDRNPYGAAMKEYDNVQLLSSFSDPKELDAYNEWKKQRNQPAGSPPAAAPVVVQPAAPAAIPKPAAPLSIASMPSAGNGGLNAIPVGPGQAFDSVFN